MKLKMLVVLFIFSLNYATSPKQPYYEYTISGNIECDSLNSLVNYTVQLYGMHKEYTVQYTPILGLYREGERPLSLTDSLGKFYISVSSDILFDSLKAGIIQPENSTLFSDAIEIKKDDLFDFVVYYEPESGSGCSYSVEPTKSRIEKYTFQRNQIIIELCP